MCSRSAKRSWGLKAKGGKMAADDTPLTELVIKPGAKLMMLG